MSFANEKEKIVILRAIDQQLLSVEDLAYFVKMPIEQVQTLVQQLWDENYIALAKRSSVPTQVSAFFGSKPRRSQVGRSMSFNLTAKGHFYLHPVKPNLHSVKLDQSPAQEEGTAQ